MEWIKNLKIANKLLALISLGLLFITITGATGYYFTNKTAAAMKTLYNDRVMPIVWFRSMTKSLLTEKNDLLELMLTSSQSENNRLYSDIKEQQKASEDYLEKYAATKLDPFEVECIDKYKKAVQDYKRERDIVIAFAMKNKNTQAYAHYQAKKKIIDVIASIIADAAGYNEKVASELKAQSDKDSTVATIILLITILSSFGLLIVLGLMISKMITDPITNAVSTLTTGTNEVSSAALQVSSASQQLAESTSEQAASIQETSATLEETSSMVHQNRENTQQAASLARQAKQYAEQSNSEMIKMSNSMTELKNSSSEIAKIIKVIDEIAFQTNILSLNAAVEAARAGDAGKGFAVVAEEVRNLAQRSAKAAKDTAIIIESNVSLSDNSVNVASNVKKSVESIADQASKVSDLLEEISVATDEQAKGVEQINQAVSQMEIAQSSNAQTADEAAAASRTLQEQAINVREIVDSLVLLVEGAGAVTGSSSTGYYPRQIEKVTYNKPKNNVLSAITSRTSVSVAKTYQPKIESKKNEGVLIEWNNGYSVGVAEMDEQHKQLVKLLNDLYAAMQTQKSSEAIGKVLNKLISYTEKHFSDEEEFMKKYSFPGLGSQMKEHTAFTDKVLKFKSDYDAGRTSMSVSITSFLKDWLLNHISISDKKYGEYVNNSNKPNPESIIPLGDF